MLDTDHDYPCLDLELLLIFDCGIMRKQDVKVMINIMNEVLMCITAFETEVYVW